MKTLYFIDGFAQFFRAYHAGCHCLTVFGKQCLRNTDILDTTKTRLAEDGQGVAPSDCRLLRHTDS